MCRARETMDFLLGSETERLTPQMAQQLTHAAQAPQRITETRLYEDCLKHVRNAAHQGQSACVFQVPYMMFGFPLYKVDYMRDALAFRFQKEGWKVSVKDDALLQLEWGEAGKGKKKPVAAPKGGRGNAGLSQGTLQLLKRVKA